MFILVELMGALQMLILVAVGLQIRLSGFVKYVWFVVSGWVNDRITNAYTRCSRIANPTERSSLTTHYSLFTINYKLFTI